MPLSTNAATNETAATLVNGLKGAFGTPGGYRPAHSRGRLTKGAFKPTVEAGTLSSAQHFNNESTPVIVRFSSSTGLPEIPDTDTNANPRGMAVRFVLSDDGHKHTDIVAHSVNAFPSRTGEEFLALLGALGAGTIGKYLEEHPAAAYFVNAPKPFPVSFGTENYFGVNAFKFVSKDGKGTFIRYRIVPEAEYAVLSDAEVAGKSASYLYDELEQRLGKEKISFKLLAQVAEEGDVTDDATKHWPEERKQVELGTITLDTAVPQEESLKEQKRIIMDPIPRVEGVEATDDPLLDMRASIYLISGKERRAAPQPEVPVVAVA